MKFDSFVLILFLVSSAFSATIFGPVQYERTSGPPDVYDTSVVAYDTTVACTLFVRNGDEHGHHRLSAASVDFNGEEIISEDDFNQHIGTIVRVITLRSYNSFHLRLRSTPGAFLTLSILRPCDAFVSLSVDTVIGDSACFSASAGGWGELGYSWDFDGDGTFDTVTTTPEICNVYEEPDTYLSKVQVEDEVECVAEDSGEVVIEKGFVFIPELLLEIDIDTLSSLSSNYDLSNKTVEMNAQNPNFVGINIPLIEPYTEIYHIVGTDTLWEFINHSLFLFHKGRFVGEYPNCYIEAPSHDSTRLLLESKWTPKESYLDLVGSFLIDTNGVILRELGAIRNAKWSEDDSLIGCYFGAYGMGNGYAPVDPWTSQDDWEIPYIEYSDTAWGGRLFPLKLDSKLTKSMHVGLLSNTLGHFYDLFYDSLIVFDKYHNVRSIVKPIINFPPRSELIFWTLPVFEQSAYDNNIYIYASYSTQDYPDYVPAPYRKWIDTGIWKFMPDPYVTVEAVCMDTLGNIIWRRTTDSLKVSVFAMSPSGKYTIGYTEALIPYGQVALWETQTNELLFVRNFSPYPDTADYKGCKPAEIFENTETGNLLILANSFTDTLYLSIDGSEIEPDFSQLSGLRFINNYLSCEDKTMNYACKIEGNHIKIYKIRW